MGWFRRERTSGVKDWSSQVDDECSESGSVGTSSGMIPLLSPRENEKRAKKYAAIDCIEERAFTILADLGMVDTTLEFSI